MKNFINLQLIPQKHINNPFNITNIINLSKYIPTLPLSVLKWTSMTWLKNKELHLDQGYTCKVYNKKELRLKGASKRINVKYKEGYWPCGLWYSKNQGLNHLIKCTCLCGFKQEPRQVLEMQTWNSITHERIENK